MKLSVGQKDLAGALRRVLPAAKGAYLPALSGVKINAGEQAPGIVLTATNLDMTIEVEVEAEVHDPGVILAPAALLSTLVSKLKKKGTVRLTANDGQLDIVAGKVEASTRLLPIDDYPNVAKPKGAGVIFDAEQIDAIRRVIPAAYRGDKDRAILQAIKFGDTHAVATDSHRLHVADLKVKVHDAQPHYSWLAEVVKGAGDELAMIADEDRVSFTSGATTWTVRNIEGKYPNWKQLIPDALPNVLHVGADDLLQAVDRIGLFAQDEVPVKLAPTEDEVEVSAATADVGEGREIIGCSYKGEAQVIAFNPHFLADAVQSITPDADGEVALRFADGLKPAVIKDERTTALLMPVRVS